MGRESRDQRHSRDMGMEQESGHRRDYKGYSTQMNRETGVAVGQKWKIGTSLREQRSEVRVKGAYFRLGQNFGDYE